MEAFCSHNQLVLGSNLNGGRIFFRLFWPCLPYTIGTYLQTFYYLCIKVKLSKCKKSPKRMCNYGGCFIANEAKKKAKKKRF